MENQAHDIGGPEGEADLECHFSLRAYPLQPKQSKLSQHRILLMIPLHFFLVLLVSSLHNTLSFVHSAMVLILCR